MSRFILGNCIDVMRGFPDRAVDLIVTDPPYLVGFKDRQGRQIAGDVTDEWLQPATQEMYRVLKKDALMVSFYGWNRVDRFMAAWKAAGFYAVGQLVFTKTYASNRRNAKDRRGFVDYRHEGAYVLAKGRPVPPLRPLPDVMPFPYTGDPFWQGSGRTIFAEGAYLMREDKDRSYEKLVDTMLSIKIDKLRAYLQNTPAANLVEEKIEKTAISIRAVLTNYVKAIRYLQGIEKNGEPFTIRDWMRGVREDRPNGWLFISSNADTHASLKPVISMWLSIAIRGLLAMGENRNRRVWIFADELPTLHKLPDLVEILPEARKFGGCYVFGIQSYAQLEDIYGVKPAATLFDVMNTRAFFRSPSREIAEFAAGEIGEKEILKASEQYSYGADPVRDGVSTGKEKERETLVSYSDIQTLPDLSCYVTLPGPYPAVKLALKYKPRPKIAEGFIQRTLDTRVDARLSALLEAREAEGSLARALFTPDAPEPEQSDADSRTSPGQPEPESAPVSPAPVKSASTAETLAAQPSVKASEAPQAKVTTVPLTRPVPAATTTAAASATGSSAAATATTGGTEQELAQQPAEQGQEMMPAGMNEDGEIEDMQAYDAWLADEQTQREMQRREEVNINHSHRRDEQDDIEIGGNF